MIANAMTSLHNLLMIMAEAFRNKLFNHNGVYLVMVAILDMVRACKYYYSLKTMHASMLLFVTI